MPPKHKLQEVILLQLETVCLAKYVLLILSNRKILRKRVADFESKTRN
jgi:hypothetical protein